MVYKIYSNYVFKKMKKPC